MEMMKNLVIRKITEKVLHIHNQLKLLEKSSKKFGIDEDLSLSELQLLKAIGRHPRNNMTEIASILGITKGAVSQMSMKLISKSIVFKEHNPSNSKEKWMSLSPKGQKIFEQSEKFYYEMFSELDDKINKMNIEQIELILDSFDLVEKYLNKTVKQ